MPYTKQIEQYLEGEMSAKEAAAFEEEVSNNPELAEAVKLHQLAIAGIQQKGNADFQAFKKRMQTEVEETPVVSINRTPVLRRLMAIAAMLLLVAVGYFLWPKTAANPMQATTTELIAFNLSGTKGSAPDPANVTFLKGIQQFQDSDFEAAITSFDQVIQNNPDKRATALFFKADALYRLGRKEEAKSMLKQIQKVDDGVIYRKVRGVLEGW